MKFSKKILAGAVAASLAMSAFAPMANAEVSASVGVASTYLWRGFELGSGTPAVSGSLDYSQGGFYAGVWGSSGDTTAGTEYDLYFGYGGEVGAFTYDVSLISYIYPTGQFSETEGVGDFMEAIISFGVGPVSLTYHDNIAGTSDDDIADGVNRYAFEEDYSYLNVSVALGDFSVAVGHHFEDADDAASSVTGDATHLDLSYAYNDNLSFTASAVVASDDGFEEADPTFVVSYSLPIE
ncbi:TorF family putative porin [Teredinibacter turnerae]|uniref:TorF family putative porin n=1 Tax=Teredinibacter turnerae TaxID=2426 RepID=UPI000360FB36|nr:TorF family putative porin [Teredinibacter turnerae]